MNTASGSILEHTIGAEGVLSIHLRDGEVRLRAVDGEVVRVRDVNGHDLGEMFGIDLGASSLALRSGRGLEVVFGTSQARRGHHHPTPELVIELPRHAALVLEAASGDVHADGLLGDQCYRTASGDVALRAVSGRIAIEVVSGDVDVTAAGEAQVTARSVSGDVALRAARLSAVQLTTTSGDLKLAGQLAGPGPFTIETVSGDALIAPAGDAQIEMTSMTGDLSSEFDGPDVTARGRRSLTLGSKGPVVTFRSMSGDLRVVRPTPIGIPDALSPVGMRDAPSPVGMPDAARPTPLPAPTHPNSTPANGAIAAAYDEARLRILRSLERGEIAVAEAGRRLETLDAGESEAPTNSRKPVAPNDG